MLRWGILGTGAVAARRYAPALRERGHDLAVVGSRSLLRAQTFAATQGVRRARGSYDEVLAADDVDAVLVALPPELHEPWTVAALEAGKHVLCPRPLAPDGPAAGRMAAAAASAGRVLVQGLPSLAHPRFQALIDLVRGGQLGDVRVLNATWSVPLADPRSYRARGERGGGALLDLGVDPLAACRLLAGGEPSGVRAVQRSWSTGVDGTSAVILSFPGGAVALVTVTFDAVAHDHLEVVGSDGHAALPGAFDPAPGEAAVLLRDGAPAGTWTADAAGIVVDDLVAAAAGESAGSGLDDAVATAELLDRVRLAADAAAPATTTP